MGNNQIPSNEDLLERYKNSDPDAFAIFYKRHQKLMFNFIRSRVKNNAETEDAFQETFFRIHRYIKNFKSDENAMAWVFQIARNVIIDQYHRRQKSAVPSADLPEESHDPSAQIEAKQTIEHILTQLPAEDAAIIKERYLEEKNYEEIAKSRGLTQSNTRQKISRILRSLKSKPL